MCLDSGCKCITFWGSFSFIFIFVFCVFGLWMQMYHLLGLLFFYPFLPVFQRRKHFKFQTRGSTSSKLNSIIWGDIVNNFAPIPLTFNQMFLSPFIILAPVVTFAKTLWHFPLQADTFYAWLFSILIWQTSSLLSLIVSRILPTTLDFPIYFFDYFQFLSNPTKFCPLVWTSEILDCWSCQGKKPAPAELY